MRLLRLAPLLFLVACGDDDKPVNPDAPKPDAAVDGSMIDAPTDGPGPMYSRVWAVGNYIDPTAATRKAGSWRDDMATFPYGNGTAPPTVVPAGTATLGSVVNGYTTFMFDATPDGTKTAFVADLTTAGRFDLYIAGKDGSNPTMLVQGSTGLEIASVFLSPDGTKVAYTMDSLLVDGGYDVYWSPTAAAAPHLVSPARPVGALTPANLDASASQISWSRDSKYLAFVGDYTEDNFFQAYCADTSTTNPAATLLLRSDIPTSSLTQGVVGQLVFDNMDSVYFGGRLVGATTQVQLYRVKPDGTMRMDITSIIPARTDTSTPDIASLGVSNDGTKLMVVADSPRQGRYDLYAHAIGQTTSANISNFTTDWSPLTTAPIWFSPDGTRAAMLGRFAVASGRAALGPFVIKLDGSGYVRLIDVATVCAGCATPDAQWMQWTMDSQAIYVRGDITTNNTSKLYRVNPTQPDQTPTIAADSPGAGDVFHLLVRPL